MEGAPPGFWIPCLLSLVDFSGSSVPGTLMRALLIVAVEEAVDSLAQLPWVLVAVKVDVLVLDGAPEPLDGDIVHPAPPPVYADLDLLLAQRVEGRVAGELPALLGVADLRLGMAIHGGPLRHPGDPERNNGTKPGRSRVEARANAWRSTEGARRVVDAKPQGCTVLVNRWHWVTL